MLELNLFAAASHNKILIFMSFCAHSFMRCAIINRIEYQCVKGKRKQSKISIFFLYAKCKSDYKEHFSWALAEQLISIFMVFSSRYIHGFVNVICIPHAKSWLQSLILMFFFVVIAVYRLHDNKNRFKLINQFDTPKSTNFFYFHLHFTRNCRVQFDFDK